MQQLIRWLREYVVDKEDLDLEVIRDAVWLALQVARQATDNAEPVISATSDEDAGSSGTQPGAAGAAGDAVEAESEAASETPTAQPEAVSATPSSAADDRASQVPIDVPAALPDALPLTWALRPLRRVRQPGRRLRLDVNGTVEATADAAGLLQPVLTRASEPAVSAHLVVDDAPSMAVWNAPIAAFADVLRRANVFREVKCWRLDVRSGSVVTVGETQRARRPPWLSPRGQDLVLVASEVRDDRWRDMNSWNAIRAWGRHACVALVNPLAPAWWPRTAMPSPVVRIHAATRRRSNDMMTVRLPARLRSSTVARDALPVPVVGLVPGDLLALSKTVASANPDGCLGVLATAARTVRPAPFRSGSEALIGFRRLASPDARRLAVLLSACEVHTIATMRIVQHDLVPESGVADLAAVLASGALLPDGYGAFSFDASARDNLHSELTAEDAYEVSQSLARALQRTGEHTATVLVLDPSGAVRLETLQRALAIAQNSAQETAGYHSATPGAGLDQRLLGLVIPDVDNPFYSQLASGVEHAARAKGYLSIVANSDSSPDKEQEILRSFCERGVDGLLVIAAPRADHEFLDSEFHMGKRVVFIDRPPQNLPADFVSSDNVGGAREAVEHLIRHGHRRIGVLIGDTAVWTDHERLQGYKDALAASRIRYDDALVKTGCRDVPTAELATYALLEQSSPPTAIFAYNNRSAIGAFGAIKDRGPTTALVGFDNFDLADTLRLTVVAQDTFKLGKLATETLLRRLSGDEFKILDERIPTWLIDRGSGEKAPSQGTPAALEEG